ncbi:hypothetical protein JOE50_002489 [Bradyrhizobium japonicum]|nr:hypothetical protein [Bradyrhizobium japonicum]
MGNPGLARLFDRGIIETRTGPLIAESAALVYEERQGVCQVFLTPFPKGT